MSVEATDMREAALRLHKAGLVPDVTPGCDPSIIRDEILGIIDGAISNHPRMLQAEIGPSEVGNPCDRRLAYRLAAVPYARKLSVSWRSAVGTAVHAWLADRLADWNRAHEVDRWLVETKVNPGEIADTDLYGSCDVYDTFTHTVIDWKIVGPTSLRNYKSNGPGQQYRTQLHLYGRGWVRMGLPVVRVANMFMPANGELSDSVFWAEEYSERIAESALQRATDIYNAAHGLPLPLLMPNLNTAPAHCAYCPWYRPGDTRDLATACPGDPRETPRRSNVSALTAHR